MARLVALSAPHPGRQFALGNPECVVGRALDCDIAIQDQRISRRHARLLRSPDGLRIEDLGSVNGTFLNSRRVQGQARLANGDEIVIGTARFVVDLSDEIHDNPYEGRVTVLDPRSLSDPMIEVANVHPNEAVLRGRGLTGAKTDPGREVERLQLKLRTLYQLGEAVASALEPRALLTRVAELLLDVFLQAQHAAAVVLDPRSGELRTVAFRRRPTAANGSAAREMLIPAPVVDRVLRQGRSVLLRASSERVSSPDISSDGGRITAISAIPIDGVAPTGWRMGSPLSFHGEHLGILYVEALPTDAGFSQADLDLLGGIAAQAGVALHLARLHQKQLVQDRLDKDLVIARQIQRSLLPREPPRLSGMEVAMHYEPAFHVGGDFFDFLWLDPTRLAVLVGDVSGKAVSGALFMARVASEFRANAPIESNPPRLLQKVNRMVANAAEDGMFCTALLASIDLERHVARFSNAGHTLPLLRRNGVVTALDDPDARTLPLGVESEIQVGEHEVQLLPGDVVLFYTDGLLEARASDGTFYGSERLARVFGAAQGNARGVIDAVLADIDEFVQDAQQADDQTVVCLRVEAASSRRCDSISPPAMPPMR